MAAISILVPVYNVSAYIEKCAHTLFSQTLSDLEYIFVDDASLDNSIDLLLKTLEHYPHRHQQVKIIKHESNAGIGAARKTALNAATSQYVLACDSDDWIEHNMCQLLYEKALIDDADIVLCDITQELPAKQQRILLANYDDSGTPQDAIKRFYHRMFRTATWNKLIKRSLYTKYNLITLSDINMGEDTLMTIRLMYYASKVSYVPQALYHYNCTNVNSITATKTYSEESISDMDKVVNIITDFFNELGDDYALSKFAFQFHAKMHFIRSGKFSEWRSKYPQSNKYILKYSYFSLKLRILLKLAAWHIDWPLRLAQKIKSSINPNY